MVVVVLVLWCPGALVLWSWCSGPDAGAVVLVQWCWCCGAVLAGWRAGTAGAGGWGLTVGWAGAGLALGLGWVGGSLSRVSVGVLMGCDVQ